MCERRIGWGARGTDKRSGGSELGPGKAVSDENGGSSADGCVTCTGAGGGAVGRGGIGRCGIEYTASAGGCC